MSCRGSNFLYTSLTVIAVLIQYPCKASDVTKPNAGNQEIEFRCHDPGVFPDPYSCSIYYLCGDPPVSRVPVPEYDYETRHVCPEGTQFDVLKESCVHVEDNNTCTEPPVPPCEQLFQTAPLQRNPSIYFICIKSVHHDLQPKLYKCPANKMYDSEHFTCKTMTTSSPVETTHSQTISSSKHTDSSTAAVTTGSGTSSTEITTKAESITPKSSSQISISISSTENPKTSSKEIFTSDETTSTEDPHISTQSTTEDVSHNSTEGSTNTKNTKITEVSLQTTPSSAGSITDTETSTESSQIFTQSTTEAVPHNSTGGSTENGTSRYTKNTGITDWSTPEFSSQTTASASGNETPTNPSKPTEDTTISSTENNNSTQSFSSKNSHKSSESTPLTTQSGITDISSQSTKEHTGTNTTSEETENSSYTTDDSSTEISSTVTETGSTDQDSSQTTTGQVIILPDIVVMTNFIAKPKQMIVNIVYDFVEDGNATNPTDAPPVTVPAGSTVTASPVTVPQTATPVTTTAGTATTSNGEFHCTSDGTFADPKDCTKFYRCNNGVVAGHDKCFLGHYDPSSQGCAFGGC